MLLLLQHLYKRFDRWLYRYYTGTGPCWASTVVQHKNIQRTHGCFWSQIALYKFGADSFYRWHSPLLQCWFCIDVPAYLCRIKPFLIFRQFISGCPWWRHCRLHTAISAAAPLTCSALSGNTTQTLGWRVDSRLIVSIPVIIIIAGPLFAPTKKYKEQTIEIFNTGQIPDDQLPSLFHQYFRCLYAGFPDRFPYCYHAYLLKSRTALPGSSMASVTLNAMVVTLLYASCMYGLKQKKSMSAFMSSLRCRKRYFYILWS